MPSLGVRSLLLPASLSLLVAASPAPGPRPDANPVAPREPLITASPVQYHPSRTLKYRRDILSSVEGYANSVLSDLGSGIPSYVASGIPNYFQGFPTGKDVQSSLGLSDSDLAALPTQVLSLDPYANYTAQGWNVLFHGMVYKQPNTSAQTLDDLANKLFIYGTNVSSLPPDQQAQTRNVTSEIFVVQQGNVAVSPIHIEPAQSQGGSGQPGGGGATTATGGTQDITLPGNTTVEGDFTVFMPINSNGLTPGNATSQIQRLNTYVGGATLGNATAYLVPDQGLTVISDIDDILRITKIYEPKEGLLNSFARPYTAWENMPSVSPAPRDTQDMTHTDCNRYMPIGHRAYPTHISTTSQPHPSR